MKWIKEKLEALKQRLSTQRAMVALGVGYLVVTVTMGIARVTELLPQTGVLVGVLVLTLAQRVSRWVNDLLRARALEQERDPGQELWILTEQVVNNLHDFFKERLRGYRLHVVAITWTFIVVAVGALFLGTLGFATVGGGLAWLLLVPLGALVLIGLSESRARRELEKTRDSEEKVVLSEITVEPEGPPEDYAFGDGAVLDDEGDLDDMLGVEATEELAG